ncbi:MAG: hypothetical protein C4292_05635 [Nitrososphaera sp.]
MNKAVTRQRIGNYDFQVAFEPNPPVAAKPMTLLMRIASVNGDDLVDVPMTIRIDKDGKEIHRVGPVIAPYGHYSYNFTFPEPGRYAVYVDLADYAYSGETLTFTFLVPVAGQSDYILYFVVPGAGAATAGAAGAAAVIMKRRKNRAAGQQ